MMAFITGAGLYLSWRTGFVQLRHFGYAMRNTLGKMFKKNAAGSGEVTPLQAVSTALAATVGTGNIAGVTAAIVLGGPGAVFWLWVTALIGMCTKYAEVVLAVKYRERNSSGDWVGGPMYYIVKGLGKSWRPLALAFSFFGALAALGIGNAVQVGAITSSVSHVIRTFRADFSLSATVGWVVGLTVAAITALTLLGGIKRLGAVAGALVPFMAVAFILATLMVCVMNFDRMGEAFAMIFEGAFRPEAAVGGGVGITLMTSAAWGVKRGIFSNEAGLGSAPIAHAASSERDPVKQGLYGIFEVFMDTIVLCTMTALALLTSGVVIPYGNGELATTALNAASFASVFGNRAGGLIIAVGITLFALATILSWGLYGTRCCEFIFGSRSIKIYQIVFVLAVIAGATMRLELVWAISDTLNGLMAIPNLVAVLALSGVVARLTREHFSGKRRIQAPR
jgi:AGCS family alanine or glycine:cation symporter